MVLLRLINFKDATDNLTQLLYCHNEKQRLELIKHHDSYFILTATMSYQQFNFSLTI